MALACGMESPIKRMWARTVVDEASGCWVWTGALFRGTGYGLTWFNGRKRSVHSLSAEVFGIVGDEGLVLDHVAARGCVHRACWNPAHLEWVTRGENVLRGTGLSAENARKTRCPYGHEYTAENTRVYRGARYCRACARARYHRLRSG